MNSRVRWAVARLVMALSVPIVGLLALQEPVRTAEARAATALLELFGAEGFRWIVKGAVLVTPPEHPAFQVIVAPSCSALTSVLALGCLAWLTPRHRGPRKLAAIGVAVVTVAAGNIVRIAASLAVGLVAGRASLVLFHDWVGSVLSFAYTLGGFILFLTLLLPPTVAPTAEASVAPA